MQNLIYLFIIHFNLQIHIHSIYSNIKNIHFWQLYFILNLVNSVVFLTISKKQFKKRQLFQVEQIFDKSVPSYKTVYLSTRGSQAGLKEPAKTRQEKRRRRNIKWRKRRGKNNTASQCHSFRDSLLNPLLKWFPIFDTGFREQLKRSFDYSLEKARKADELLIRSLSKWNNSELWMGFKELGWNEEFQNGRTVFVKLILFIFTFSTIPLMFLIFSFS